MKGSGGSCEGPNKERGLRTDSEPRVPVKVSQEELGEQLALAQSLGGPGGVRGGAASGQRNWGSSSGPAPGLG